MAALLEVKSLEKRYGPIVAADAVTFALEEGGCLGLVGPNGAGKTSLFSMIAGTIRPDSGTIRFAGRPITDRPAHARARLGIVRAFQIPQPFTQLTVAENVRAAAYFAGGLRGREVDAWTAAVLERTELAGKAETLADGLRLLDRKRLELAKAIASKARLLLLDEIAGGLTEREVDLLLGLIRRLKEDHTIVWIEHIPRALKAVADRVLVLHFGKLLIDGPPDEVMASAPFRQIYMGLPADAA